MSILLYGAYGYTGELIAREATARDLDVVLAGRNGTKTRGLAAMLDTDSRVFATDEAPDYLDDIDILLNCAGPFIETSGSLVDACLDTGTHYLDITGELPVFETLAERDRDAERVDSLLLPGIGFDVVPTDCVAGHLHDRLPGATDLRLGIDAAGSISSGTAVTALKLAGGGGKIRRDGRIVDVPVASERRTVDFGDGPRHAARIPWGDISTAYYTTGIENIEVYAPMPATVARLLELGAGSLLGIGPVQRALQSLARRLLDGPSAHERETGRALIWGEATDGDRTVTTRLRSPEPYALTVDAATTAVSRLADSDQVPTGYQTPASAFDPDFVRQLDGVEGFFDGTAAE